MKPNILIIAFFFLALIQACSIDNDAAENSFEFSRDQYPDVLNIHKTPKHITDWTAFSFADQGAWFSFALPADTDNANYAGVIGPFMMTEGKWMSSNIAQIKLSDSNSGEDIKLINPELTYLPGMLTQKFKTGNLNLTQKLIFTANNQTLVTYQIKNTATDPIKLNAQWSGSLFEGYGSIAEQKNNIVIGSANDNVFMKICFPFSDNSEIKISDSKQEYEIINNKPIVIEGNSITTIALNIHFLGDSLKDVNNISDPKSIATHFEINQNRWDYYVNKCVKTDNSWGKEDKYQRVAVKSLMTLINNWRSKYRDLYHDGLFPSYAVNYFNGFWAWDSWKHSVALAKFAPDLAKDQIRTMYDYQNKEGMIADCIYTNKEYNNWLNTKPPLSGWAIWEVFKETKDTSFIEEMFPKLVTYHKWWYNYRDINRNKLCEYGSTDGSLVAAKWESGMDNAVRFDKSKMIKLNNGNWSFNQESVDLNAYLYEEKIFIAKMANILDKKDIEIKFLEVAKTLKETIKSKMFDAETGFFFDIDISDNSHVKEMGPEGWIPLFTNVADSLQAKGVVKNMLDTTKFSSYIPYPTVSLDNKEFSEGYWRGPIWLDQVYFAQKSLLNYGYGKEAQKRTQLVFDRLEGLTEDAPIRENYWPINGKGMRVNHFSWSAAHILMLYHEDYN